jgi:hypothetical protein
MRGAGARLVTAMLVASALSGCTRGLSIHVDYGQQGVQFSFWTNGWFPRRETPCIWLFQVADERTKMIVVERKNADRCVKLDILRLSQATPGLVGKGVASSLVPGRIYRASFVADGEQGRSEAWVAK